MDSIIAIINVSTNFFFLILTLINDLHRLQEVLAHIFIGR